MTCFFEPVKGPGNERRDELGNTAPYRKHPHLGEDWGFSNGSEGKDIWAMHDGKVMSVKNEPALGWTLIQSVKCDVCKFTGYKIEYNHMLQKPELKVGDIVEANKTVIGKIGATGSALSAAGANHLHASMAKADVPHTAPLANKISLFDQIDKSTAERAAIRKSIKAKLGANPEGTVA
jgi:murein DD-endopeptidase MepM/ murein hydrolase activator NlpD